MSLSSGVEGLLNTLAERVLVRRPTVGYMRTTIAAYSDLKRLAPAGGALVHILAVARISNGSAKTFERYGWFIDRVIFTFLNRLFAGLLYVLHTAGISYVEY